MKPTHILSLLSALTLGLPLSALGQGKVATEAFLEPSSSFSFASSVSDLRVTDLADAATTDQTTHILIEGLVPIEAGSSVVTSSYRGINLSSGATTEVGSLYFTMPSGSTSSSATSPIVGIVARSGTWDDFNPTTPNSTLGGGQGDVSVSGGETGTVTLSILKGSTTYNGTADFTVLDEKSVELSDFALSAGSSSIEFYGTVLSLWGGEYYGVVQAKAPSDFNSTMLTLRFLDMPDGDNDGIPDWTDDSSGFTPPPVGEWKYTSELGWAFGLQGNVWARSYNFGNVYFPNFPWLYVQGPPSGPTMGWVRFIRRDDSSGDVFLYSAKLGWLFTRDDLGGWYYSYSIKDYGHFHVDI